MLITKESDYSIRIIRALADNEKKTVKTICEQELIPHKFAYKILKKLSDAGFVQSFQGPDGGYKLARTLCSFTLYDIISAANEDILLFECMRKDWECPLNNSESPCAAHRELERIQNIMVKEMKLKTMDEVLT